MTIKCNCNYFLTFKKLEAAPPVAYVHCTYIPDDPENFGARCARACHASVSIHQLGVSQAQSTTINQSHPALSGTSSFAIAPGEDIASTCRGFWLSLKCQRRSENGRDECSYRADLPLRKCHFLKVQLHLYLIFLTLRKIELHLPEVP